MLFGLCVVKEGEVIGAIVVDIVVRGLDAMISLTISVLLSVYIVDIEVVIIKANIESSVFKKIALGEVACG